MYEKELAAAKPQFDDMGKLTSTFPEVAADRQTRMPRTASAASWRDWARVPTVW